MLVMYVIVESEFSCVQILNEAVCIFHNTNTLEKATSRTILK